jgi:hypothetical protein
MYKELNFKMHDDGVLELSGVFAPDFAEQAAKFIKDFQTLDPEDVQSRIEIDVAKATVRVDVMIPPTAGLPRQTEGFRAIDMTCEKHPWLEWPHDDCAGPGTPLSDSLDLLRRLYKPPGPESPTEPRSGYVAGQSGPAIKEPRSGSYIQNLVGELEPGPLTEVVGHAADKPKLDRHKVRASKPKN